MTMRQSSGSVRILDARLTRSLADFAKLVELFDGHGVSFVSVTQQFNTTTSMGRLTLNVLLSFAQFEREVTSERIRDKIAASKRKGLWVGGMAPLGYETKDRKIVVVEEEAERVRTIFFAAISKLGSLKPLDGRPPQAGDRHQGAVSQDRAHNRRDPIHPAARSPIFCTTGSISERSPGGGVFPDDRLPHDQGVMTSRHAGRMMWALFGPIDGGGSASDGGSELSGNALRHLLH
jgi:hypothetical protein